MKQKAKISHFQVNEIECLNKVFNAVSDNTICYHVFHNYLC